jgi:undecaprenyl phosphate-alpha-L-ara4N flippase subunit ArnE
MTAELVILFTVSLACDVFGQTFFKLGAIGLDDRDDARGLTATAWIALGLATYVVEIFVWLRVLALAPLTIAAPIASLNYIGVVLVSRWLFAERISPRQWLGAGFVTLGVVAVALTGG